MQSPQIQGVRSKIRKTPEEYSDFVVNVKILLSPT